MPSNGNGNSNGIATAEDFRRVYEERRRAKAEPIVLPCGLKVMAYRPGLEWYARQIGRMPQSMAARIDGVTSTPIATLEQLAEFSSWSLKIIETVIVEPKICLDPQTDKEASADIISEEDVVFLLKYAGGEISVPGEPSLDTFPGQPGRTDVGPGSGTVESPTQ